MKIGALLSDIKETFGGRLRSAQTLGGELSFSLCADDLHMAAYYLKNREKGDFAQLMDICAVDYPERLERFEVVYNFLSLRYNMRIRLKVPVSEGEMVPSLSGIYKCANWWEREVWDMFGIKFIDHPDMRRILTDYGFEGHPLRKDFPVMGYTQVKYCEVQKRVVYEPVDLEQDFRYFDFESPWQEIKNVLHGDEKANQQDADNMPSGN